MERLFRGITWLPGNSVALPRRPGYFRLQYLFVFVCVCLSSYQFTCPYGTAAGVCPILRLPVCTSILPVCVCVCVCVCFSVCVCVCVLL